MELLEKTIDAHVESREKFFEGLYENVFPVFAGFAGKMNASFDDAKDIFHDALVIYYEKTMEPGFHITTSPEAYILGICKHLWIRKYNHDRHKISLDRLESSISIPMDYCPTVNETELLRFLQLSGKPCLELLEKFYYGMSPLKEIARALGYRSAHSAAVQKFKCLGKIRQAIKSNSKNYEDFLS